MSSTPQKRLFTDNDSESDAVASPDAARPHSKKAANGAHESDDADDDDEEEEEKENSTMAALSRKKKRSPSTFSCW